MRLFVPYVEKKQLREVYRIGDGLKALAETPALWAEGRKLANGLKGSPLIRDCMRYAAGDDSVRGKLQKQFRAGEDMDAIALILSCFASRRDRSLVSEGMGLLKSGHGLRFGLVGYLSEVCSGTDLPALEQASLSEKCQERWQVAELILQIRFEAYCHQPSTRP